MAWSPQLVGQASHRLELTAQERGASPSRSPEYLETKDGQGLATQGLRTVKVARMRMLLALFLLLSAPLRAETLVVFAAASLGGALDEVADGFEGEVTLSYAGSASLARQVAAGAPADVVILANTAWMDHLAEAGAIVGDPRDILSNRLVLIVPQGQLRETNPADPLAGLGRIATGFTEAVPVGIYARQALENLQLWETARARLVETENARLALALVARGDVEGGIVYRSDAVQEPRVAVQAELSPDLHAPIRYPAAVTARSRNTNAGAFLDLLLSPAAQAIFAAHGYEPAP